MTNYYYHCCFRGAVVRQRGSRVWSAYPTADSPRLLIRSLIFSADSTKDSSLFGSAMDEATLSDTTCWSSGRDQR